MGLHRPVDLGYTMSGCPDAPVPRPTERIVRTPIRSVYLSRRRLGLRVTSPDDFDVDTHVAQRATVGIVDDGVEQFSSLEPIVDILNQRSIYWNATDANLNNPPRTLIQYVNVIEVINRVYLSPSAHNELVGMSIGDIEFIVISGVYYPNPTWKVMPGENTLTIRMPAKRNYVLAFVVYPATYTNPYIDAARIATMYEPDTRERLVAPMPGMR